MDQIPPLQLKKQLLTFIAKLHELGKEDLLCLVSLTQVVQPELDFNWRLPLLSHIFTEMPAFIETRHSDLPGMLRFVPPELPYVRLLLDMLKIPPILNQISYPMLLTLSGAIPQAAATATVYYHLFIKLQALFQQWTDANDLRLYYTEIYSTNKTPKEKLQRFESATMVPVVTGDLLPLLVKLLKCPLAELEALKKWMEDLKELDLILMANLFQFETAVLIKLKKHFQMWTLSGDTTITDSDSLKRGESTTAADYNSESIVDESPTPSPNLVEQQPHHPQLPPSPDLRMASPGPITKRDSRGILKRLRKEVKELDLEETTSINSPEEVDEEEQTSKLSPVPGAVFVPLEMNIREEGHHRQGNGTKQQQQQQQQQQQIEVKSDQSNNNGDRSSSPAAAPRKKSKPPPPQMGEGPKIHSISQYKPPSPQIQIDQPEQNMDGVYHNQWVLKVLDKGQPPSQTVYQRILKPAPAVILLPPVQDNSIDYGFFVEASLVRSDDNTDLPSTLEGTKIIRIEPGKMASFKKLKIISTTQQIGSLVRLKFQLKKANEGSFITIAGINTMTNPIEVFSHTYYLNRVSLPAPPSVTEILPSGGPACGGTRVAILGDNFIESPNLRIRFGNTILQPIFHESRTLICHTPYGLPQSIVLVSVSNDGVDYSLAQAQFIYDD